MATMNKLNNSINSCALAAGCPSALVTLILDAAIILVVSVLVCLRVTMLGS